jgi:hypothetical protein
MTRNCIVIANLANFTGTINHGIKNDDGSYQKLRVDYNELLRYLVGDRKLLGAYVISQQDTTSTNPKSLEAMQANQRFVQKLKNFGWTPIRVSYNSQEHDMSGVLDAIWQNSLTPLVDAEGKWTINPALTDVVFVNGSAAWFDIINAYFDSGFQVEVAYPKSATSKLLTANFAFLDTTQFLFWSNQQLSEKGSVKP